MDSLKETRRDFLKTAAASMAALTLSESITAGKESVQIKKTKPNILLILVDDLGYGDLSSYGAQDLKTLHIDHLVSSGTRWENFYANCPVCSPTRASLLTGRYPDLVGVPGVIRTQWQNNFGYLHPQAIMLPTVLKRAGYHTALIGKWHLGLDSPNIPNERGFDHFHGFLGDMMDDYYKHRRGGINFMRLNEKEIDPPGHATDLFTQWAIDYLNQQAKANHPFFMFLSYNAPHTPIQPPPDWLDIVKKRQPGIDDKRAKLIALIEHLDDGIGKVITALKKSDQANNTLIIFTSDNGGQLSVGANNGLLNGGKGDMYEGGIRVPFCAVWPGKVKAGSVNTDHVALSMDLFHTISAAAGARFEHEIDGHDFLPTLLGQNQPSEDRLLIWVRREGGNHGGRAYYSVRQGPWKLLQNTPFEPMRLYNLKDDPREQQPLPKNHRQYQRLFTALQRHIIQAGAVPWRKFSDKIII
ncbi:sulfatase-like hydrolase/transferase [Planctomycetota bacterium]